jgi:hypothetical protein
MFDSTLLAPDFASRRALSMDELVQLDEPAVLFEHFHVDTDGAHAYVYTVAGWLKGRNVVEDNGGQGGCTVGGDVIVVHAKDRAEADEIACGGLLETINALVHGPRLSSGFSIEGQARPLSS